MMHVAPTVLAAAFAFAAGTLAMLAVCFLIAGLLYAFFATQRRDL